MEQKVSIIIPVIRPDSANKCVDAILKNAGVPGTQYEILMERDIDGIGCPEMVKILTEKSKYDLVLFLGDDTRPEKDFLKHAIDSMNSFPGGWGVVGLNTRGPSFGEDREKFPKNSNPLAHWLAHKKILEHIPGKYFFPTDYKHCWCDNELKDIASEIGRWCFCEKSRIDHLHPVNQNADIDDGYKKAYSKDNEVHDFKTYCQRKRDRMKLKYDVKLAIAIPLTDETVYRHFLFSIIKVITEYMSGLARVGKSMACDVLMPDFPCQVDAARNNLVHQALLLGCTHILMMDSDQIYATDNLIEKMLSHKKPVVGARVHRRYPPFDPLLLRGKPGKLYQVKDEEIKNKDGSFKTEVPVDYTGTGCIMYDMQIFNDMIPKKWFRFSVGDNGQAIGEDINFCDELKKANIPIIVDCSIDIKHLTLMAADWSTYKLFQKIMK